MSCPTLFNKEGVLRAHAVKAYLFDLELTSAPQRNARRYRKSPGVSTTAHRRANRLVDVGAWDCEEQPSSPVRQSHPGKVNQGEMLHCTMHA